MTEDGSRILLGVTADASVPFLAGAARDLARRGWDVHVVVSGGSNAEALAASGGVTVHSLPMSRDPDPLRDLLALVRVVALVRRLRPDVVSAATPKAGLLLGLASCACRVPVRVYQLWGLRYETTGGAVRRVLLALEKIAARAATNVVSVSESLRRVAVADGLVSPARITVLGPGSSHGVDVDRFASDAADRRAARSARWPSEDLAVVGYVGRLHPDKGIDTLAAGVAELSRRGVRARLLLVGGAEGAEGALAALADTSWEVEVTGHVADVAPWLRLMDVLCLPSRREGFPNVVLEAAAAGVPSVVTPATGTVDAVVDRETGLVAADHDPRALAASLAEVLGDPDLRAQLGMAARGRVRAEFEQSLVWDRYADHYAALVAASGLQR